MLTELRNALAILVAAEARIHELVDPTIVHTYVSDVAKANAAAIQQLADRLAVAESQITDLVEMLGTEVQAHKGTLDTLTQAVTGKTIEELAAEAAASPIIPATPDSAAAPAVDSAA